MKRLKVIFLQGLKEGLVLSLANYLGNRQGESGSYSLYSQPLFNFWNHTSSLQRIVELLCYSIVIIFSLQKPNTNYGMQCSSSEIHKTVEVKSLNIEGWQMVPRKLQVSKSQSSICDES